MNKYKIGRQRGESVQLATRFKVEELEKLDELRGAGTEYELPRSEYIRSRTLKVTCKCKE